MLTEAEAERLVREHEWFIGVDDEGCVDINPYPDDFLPSEGYKTWKDAAQRLNID